MQTSKITIGNVYAVRRAGWLGPVRFRVDAIATRKSDRGTSSTIEGRQIGDDAPKGDDAKFSVDPTEIIGEYETVAELAAKAAAEKAAREAVEKAKKDAANALVFELYKATGLTRNAKNEYSQPFRTEYSGAVEIRQEAVEAVLRVLKTRVAAFAAHDHLSIYATGQTREEAVAKARADARDDEAQFETSKIEIPLAYYIEANGWNGHSDSFDVVDGWIANPTHHGKPLKL